jgi:proton-translocating NADH-quinone oxidoreductase chain L
LPSDVSMVNLLSKLVLFTVFIPLIGSILTAFRSYYYCSKDHPALVSTICVFLSFISSILILLSRHCHHRITTWTDGVWFFSSNYVVEWSYRADAVTCSMFLVVTGVSFFVHLYSIYYMRGDPALPRFFSFLSLFTFFMLVLVSSGNLIQLFIGWEGVGLCSFLLISFWSERTAANKAAVKAMVINKIGDCFFIFGSAQLLQLFGSVDLSFLFENVKNFGVSTSLFFDSTFLFFETTSIYPALLFIVLGVMAKSAQFGFHTWLPDAMEGPTPVSALIHAATMVTAGVVLLLRFSPLISLSPNIQLFIVFVGLLTMIFAATTALFQSDIKKVIAYSTCSQLGYMVAACGYSFYGVAFFHLLSHGFFKALLFLCAGSLIHFFLDEQDSRKMGGAYSFLPLTYVSFFIATLSLLAFPFTSGFYSKDWLLELFFIKGEYFSFFGFLAGSLTALLTAFYSFKIFFSTMLNSPLASKINYTSYHPEDTILYFVFIPLALFSLVFGFFFKNHFFTSISFFADVSAVINTTLPLYFKLMPFFFTLAGAVFSYLFVFHHSFFNIGTFFYNLYSFLYNKWYFDYIYNSLIVNKIYYFSHSYSFSGVEKGWIEFFGPTGSYYFFQKFSLFINRLQNGDFFMYLFFFTAGLLSFLI